MRRTDRLFELIQIFRTGSLWRGAEIAEKLEVSLRTVYRDIDTLIASGIPIEGERGVGYMLRDPIFLPPLTLTEDELEVLQFAIDHVRNVGSDGLTGAAESLRGKIDSVVPSSRQVASFARALAHFAPSAAIPALDPLRISIREKHKVQIEYLSLAGVRTSRVLLPLQLEWWGAVWTLTAWCELRSGFRVFRVDRILGAEALDEGFVLGPGQRYEDYLETLECGSGQQ